MSEAPQNTDTPVESNAQSCGPCYKSKCRLPMLLLLVLILVIGGGLFAAKDILKLRFSEPFKMASEAVVADSTVIEKLGEPLKTATFPSGELANGDCRLFFTVTGPKGEAAVSAQARVRSGVWAFNQLEVAFADGSKASVETASEEGGLEEAPAWTPPSN